MDDALLRQRRNLIGMSFVLLLYMAGKGSINALFGVQLAREWVPILFAWIGLIYFWWRFWLFGGRTAFKEFRVECANFAPRNPKLIPHARRLIDLVRPEALDHDANVTLLLKLDAGGGPKYTLSVQTSEGSAGIPIQTGCQLDQRQQMSLVRRNWIFTALNGRAFSDYLLPHFFAAFVLFIGFAQLFVWAWSTLKPFLGQ